MIAYHHTPHSKWQPAGPVLLKSNSLTVYMVLDLPVLKVNLSFLKPVSYFALLLYIIFSGSNKQLVKLAGYFNNILIKAIISTIPVTG